MPKKCDEIEVFNNNIKKEFSVILHKRLHGQGQYCNDLKWMMKFKITRLNNGHYPEKWMAMVLPWDSRIYYVLCGDLGCFVCMC